MILPDLINEKTIAHTHSDLKKAQSILKRLQRLINKGDRRKLQNVVSPLRWHNVGGLTLYLYVFSQFGAKNYWRRFDEKEVKKKYSLTDEEMKAVKKTNDEWKKDRDTLITYLKNARKSLDWPDEFKHLKDEFESQVDSLIKGERVD